uniref:Hipothetical protein n=1 Tax=Ixodes ricinus TaxID=34613 RepID=A0A0K8RCT4_IXORI
MYKFLFIANFDQRLRYAYYFDLVDKSKRVQLSTALVQKCLSRTQTSCSFFEHEGFSTVYRRVGRLLFIIGTDGAENHLAVYEFVQAFVQVLDVYFAGRGKTWQVADMRLAIAKSSATSEKSFSLRSPK